MNDVERRLAELGERARQEAGPLRARPEALRRIRRRRGLVSGVAALSVVAVVAGGIGLAGLEAADRDAVRPVATPAPSPGERGRCTIAFAPTYLPDGVDAEPRPGSGGSPDAAAAEEAGIIGHFRGPQGTFIDVLDGPPPSAVVRRSGITVLGARATLGVIHEGYAVAFRAGRCRYALAAYGVTRDQLRRFAEGLLATRPGRGPTFAAVWPEDTLDGALEACARSPRPEPVDVAARFVDDVLGWDDPFIAATEPGGRRMTLEVRPSFDLPSDVRLRPGVQLFMKKALPRCWSIGSIYRLSDRRPTGLGVSVSGRTVDVGFDPLDATKATIEVGYGGRRVRGEWKAPDDPHVRLQLDFPPDTTGSLLVLFKDGDGTVIRAMATPLPPGDFAAG